MSTSNFLEKPTSTINIKHVVPTVLDLDQMNYDIWRELFEIHYIDYEVADHLVLSVLTPSSSSTEKAPENTQPITKTNIWKHNDSIVKSWLYDTLSLPLLHLIFKKQTPPHEVWETIEKVFRDNKNNKVIQIDNEL